jgi:hypothetical protein
MCVPVHALVDVKLIAPLASLFAVSSSKQLIFLHNHLSLNSISLIS